MRAFKLSLLIVVSGCGCNSAREVDQDMENWKIILANQDRQNKEFRDKLNRGVYEQEFELKIKEALKGVHCYRDR